MSAFLRILCLLLVAVNLGDAFTAVPSATTMSRQTTSLTAYRSTVMTMMTGATTIEKEQVKTGGPAVADRPQTQKRHEPTKQRKGEGHEAWEVRIYNDGLNTREHVARSLVQVTGMSEISAYQTMMQAHQSGMAVVGRWVYEVAEMYHDALRKNGIVCDIVPVEEE